MSNTILEMTEELQQRIRDLAYMMWESAGRQNGAAVEYWLAAEREVVATLQAATERMMPSSKPAGKAAAKAKADAPAAPAAAKKAAPAVPAGEAAQATATKSRAGNGAAAPKKVPSRRTSSRDQQQA